MEYKGFILKILVTRFPGLNKSHMIYCAAEYGQCVENQKIMVG